MTDPLDETAARLDTARTRAASMFRALPEEIHTLGRLFEAAGHELALVGGPVRDAVLGRSSADLDFTTSARPDDTEAILRTWTRDGAIWDMGRDFGTLGGVRDGVKVEITTYRTSPTIRRAASPRSSTETPSRATCRAGTSPSTRWRCGSPRSSWWTPSAGSPTSPTPSCAPPSPASRSATTRCA